METWNKNYVPAGTDQWNLVADMQRLAVQNNRVIPVYSKAERNQLTTDAPTGGIPEGTVALRMDQSTDGPVFDVFTSTGWVEGDSGWVNMTYKSGFTAGTPGQLAYKVSNGTLYLRGGASGTFTPGAYMDVTSGLIPTRFRPADTTYMPAAGQGGNAAVSQITSAGQFRVVVPSAVSFTPGWVSVSGVSVPLF